MPTNPKPSRGEIWLVDLGMVEKIRPALVLSGVCADSDRDLITVIPHTTTLRGSRFEIAVPMPFLKPGAFLAQSPATVPAPRSLKCLGRMQPADVSRIETALLSWLAIKSS
jgi:mRNA interferase MazF